MVSRKDHGYRGCPRPALAAWQDHRRERRYLGDGTEEYDQFWSTSLEITRPPIDRFIQV